MSDPSPAEDSEKGRRPYAKGVARRQQILDRAIEVFADKGAEGTSLRAIAERIGVSHAALLHYFGSREELLIEVLRHWEALRGGSPREVVGGMVDAAAYNVTVPGFVALYTSLLAGSLEPDKAYSRDFFAARFARVRGSITELVRAGQAAGTIRAGIAPEDMAALVIAASDGLQTQWLLDPAVDIARSLRLLELILTPDGAGPDTSASGASS